MAINQFWITRFIAQTYLRNKNDQKHIALAPKIYSVKF